MGRLPQRRLWRGCSAGRHGERAAGWPAPGAADCGCGARVQRLACGLGVAGTVALLTVTGAARALLDIASRTLLQRSVPPQLLGRVFGLLEGLTMAGLALGSLLVPLLVYLGGSRLALLGVAAVLPLAAAAGGRVLFALDTEAPVPVVQIALLRSLPLFAELPAPAIEGLAAALTPFEVPPGAVLIRHRDRDRAHRRDRVPAQQGALPDRRTRPWPHPCTGEPHRRCAAVSRPSRPGHQKLKEQRIRPEQARAGLHRHP